MNAYVEECRHEWKRLGVPDGLAEEMATELESDLAEAEADGIAAAEMLGDSDPHRFAATWARERGLVPEQPGLKKSRTRLWIWVAVGVVLLLLVLLPALALIGSGGGSVGSVHTLEVTPVRRQVQVPDFVGMTACQALRTAHDAGVGIVRMPEQDQGSPCTLIVRRQDPAPGSIIGRHGRLATVILRVGRS